jgi:hypothetical protein
VVHPELQAAQEGKFAEIDDALGIFREYKRGWLQNWLETEVSRMGVAVGVHRHSYGQLTTFDHSEADFLTADQYPDQVSVNWTTTLTFSGFIGVASSFKVDAHALIMSSDPSIEAIEGEGFEVSALLANGVFEKSSPAFARYWFPHASLAWQPVLTASSISVNLVGLAGPLLDFELTSKLISRTATPGIQEMADYILSELGSIEGHAVFAGEAVLGGQAVTEGQVMRSSDWDWDE